MSNFLDRLSDDFNKGIKNISSKSKELIEITKLKSDIKEYQRQIPEKYTKLGKKVYEMNNKQGFDQSQIQTQCEEISKLFKSIHDLEVKIVEIEKQARLERVGTDKSFCPKCNEVNFAGDKFCFSCGYALEGSTDTNSGGTNLDCTSCGNTIDAKSKFCMKCGARTNKSTD